MIPQVHLRGSREPLKCTWEVVGIFCGAVALASTLALTGATLAYGVQIADRGLKASALESEAIATGINTYAGSLTCQAVADDHGLVYTPVDRALGS